MIEVCKLLYIICYFRDSLAFATEPVFSSLANVLGFLDNGPQPPNSSLKDYKLHEIEIKYGLLQVNFQHKFTHITFAGCTDLHYFFHRVLCIMFSPLAMNIKFVFV